MLVYYWLIYSQELIINNSALIVFNYGLFGGLIFVWVSFLKWFLLVTGSLLEFGKMESKF